MTAAKTEDKGALEVLRWRAMSNALEFHRGGHETDVAVLVASAEAIERYLSGEALK